MTATPPTDLSAMGDDIFDPAAVIAQAKRSLATIDTKLAEKREQRDNLSREIKTLTAQREQMVRIAGADTKKKVNRKPAASFTPPAT